MAEVILRNGMTCIVDDEDFQELNKYSWGIISHRQHKYASRGTRKKGQPYSKILMHRQIMNFPKDSMVDHINGNTLDNRKQNLRLATRAQNLQNSKLRSDSKCKYKGVSRKKKITRSDVYIARIQIDINTRLYLGQFDSEIEAAKAYDNAAIKYFGENANLNFKRDKYG